MADQEHLNINNADRLFELVQELSRDVKLLPSRHEFDNLADSQRRGFENLEAKFEKYVLQSEFNTYKELVGHQFSQIVPRGEHEARWATEAVVVQNQAVRLELLEDANKKYIATRFQVPGLNIVLPIVLSAIVSMLVGTYAPHQPASPSGSSTTTTSSSSTNTQRHP